MQAWGAEKDGLTQYAMVVTDSTDPGYVDAPSSVAAPSPVTLDPTLQSPGPGRRHAPADAGAVPSPLRPRPQPVP